MLSKIFALLLNTKVDTAEKIKRIIKITIKTTIKIWQEEEDYVSRHAAYPSGSSTESTAEKKNNQPIQNKKNTARIKDGNITKNEQIITIIKVK